MSEKMEVWEVGEEGECDDVYRTLSTRQSILRSRGPEVLRNKNMLLLIAAETTSMDLAK